MLGPYANPYGLDDWRMKEKMKTVSAVLILCLNIGVDPPDVIKTTPCAKLECWVDPFGQPAPKGSMFFSFFLYSFMILLLFQ